MRATLRGSGWGSIVVVFSMSVVIAFVLMGRQVFSANWGIVDDHEIFRLLGTRQHLPINEFFDTLWSKTEVGAANPDRFRPSYYSLLLLETIVWGKNVHLWYLARTLWFATFIAAVWWLLSKYVRVWLAAALLLPLLFLPFWSGIWARLGPSEIYGTWGLGLLLFGSYATILSKNENGRKAAAVLATFAALVLIGSKETLMPLAGAAVVVLLFAGFDRRIPVWMAVCLLMVIGVCAGEVVFVVHKSVAGAGEDYYGNAIDMRSILTSAAHATNRAVFGNGLAIAYAAAIAFFGYCARRAGHGLRNWMDSSLAIVVIFVFMAAVYFSQQVVYRGQLPLQMRYDFPASLFFPFSCYLLLCYVFYNLQFYLHPRMTGYLSVFLTLVISAVYAPKFVHFEWRPLPRAVSINIQKTDEFFNEISSLAALAKRAPRSPIILEAHNLDSYEGLTSVRIYARAMGVQNPISVRSHAMGSSQGGLFDRIVERIKSWEVDGGGEFTPLSESLSHGESGCISVGINGPANEACQKFEVRT